MPVAANRWIPFGQTTAITGRPRKNLHLKTTIVGHATSFNRNARREEAWTFEDDESQRFECQSLPATSTLMMGYALDVASPTFIAFPGRVDRPQDVYEIPKTATSPRPIKRSRFQFSGRQRVGMNGKTHPAARGVPSRTTNGDPERSIRRCHGR